MIFSLPATELRLAQNSLDPKTERHYIRCVYVHKEGYLSATDGRIAFLSRQITDPTSDPENPQMLSLAEDVAFFPAKNKKPNASTKRVEINTEAKTMSTFDANDGLLEIIPLEIVEGRRVQYDQFLAKHEPANDSTASINPQLLKVLSNLESTSVTFTVGAEGTPSLVKATEGMFLINPQKFTDIDLPALVK